MKQLTAMSVCGLKSLDDVTIEVPRLLALAGENGSGKTSVLQAIKLGILGYDPSMGKKLQETRKLMASPAGIDLALFFSDGFSIHRTFGDSLETVVAPPKDERIEKERQARINEETGAFIISFDIESYLKLSPQFRMEMLFSLLPRENVGLSVELFRHWLGYGEANDVTQRGIDFLWTEHVLKAESGLDGLAAALHAAHEKQKDSEQVRQKQVTIYEAAKRDAEQLTVALDYNPARAAHLQEELAKVQQDIGALQQQAEEVGRAGKRAAERTKQIETVSRKLRDAQTELHTAVETHSRLHMPTDEEISAAKDIYERAARKQKHHASAVEYTLEQKEAVKATLTQVREQIEILSSAKATCPTCTSLINAPLLLSSLGLRDDELSVQLGDRSADHADAQRIAAELSAATESARATLTRIEKARENVVQVAKEIESLRRRVEDARAELGRIESAELAAPAPPDPIEVEATARQARELLNQIDTEQRAARAAGEADAARKRADDEHRKLNAATERAAALKTVYGALQRLRSHVIKQLVAPVEDSANGILRTIDPHKTFRFIFEVEGKDDFDFGFEQGDKFRSFFAASKGEDAFLLVVLIAALIEAVRPAWSVILVDNVENVDDVRRRFLMLALAAVGDRFGNVILSGCCRFAEIEGWTVLDVAKLTGNVAQAAA